MNSKDTFFSKKRTINFRGKLVDLQSPVIMGIINLTPDSFYEGSRYTDESAILKRCEAILSEGAQIIDIGAYSSRPGAEHISEETELERLLPALKLIRKEFPEAILSVDTFRSQVAKVVVESYHVHLINDISAGEMDKEMIETIAMLNVPYVAMHMKGNPQTMQQQTEAGNVMLEMIDFFAKKIEKFRQNGLKDVLIDPGFGFGKTLEQNYHILSHLEELRIFELPILVGLSRKSMVYKLLESTPVDSLSGTIVLHTLALLKGADMLRVHDVKETVETIKIVKAYKNIYL